MQDVVNVAGGGGYPPGGGGPPPGGGGPPGGWGPPPGSPGGGGYGPPPGAPPGGYGPPGGGPPPGAPPGGYGPPQPPPGGQPPGYGPPGGPPPGAPPGGYGPPGGPPQGPPPGGYGPPQGPPPGGYGPPQGPPPGGYGPPGGAPPGGYGPGGGGPGGGYGPPGYGPPGAAPPGGYGPGGGPPGWGGPPGMGGPPPGYPGGFVPPGASPTLNGASSWSPTQALGFGWNALMRNFAGVSLPIAAALLLAIVPGYAITFVYAMMASVVAEYVEPSFLGILGYLVQATTSLLLLLLGSYIAGGIAAFALKVVRGQPVAFADVFSGGRYFGAMLIAGIGFNIAAAIGYVLCIVPGVIVSLGLLLYSFIIVDQGASGIDALKKSWEMTNGHKLNLFVFGLLAVVSIFAGLLACGVGALLVSYPMCILGAAYIYVTLKGEQPRLA